MSRIYYTQFTAVAITAQTDLFEILTPASCIVMPVSVRLAQTSDFGDAQDEILSLTWFRGHTTTGSGGTTVTPSKADNGDSASGCTTKTNNTTLATGGSPVTLPVDGWNVRAGYIYVPVPDEFAILSPSTRLVLRMSAPADSITGHGTITFKEIG